MRKLLLASVITSIVILTLSSCTKEYFNEYLPGRTFIYERTADQWRGDNNDAFLELQIKELDTQLMLQGSVTIAMSSNNEATYYTIPATINGVAYSFEYSRGKIIIKAQDPVLEDFDVTVPDLSVFKITLTDADFVE